jgi:transcriptional regulator with XRE-family HTH domain
MGRQPRIYPTLAEFLRFSGKTQADVAKAAGVSQATISRYLETGRDLKLSVALRIANYCRIPVEALQPKREEPEAPKPKHKHRAA